MLAVVILFEIQSTKINGTQMSHDSVYVQEEQPLGYSTQFGALAKYSG